MRFRIDALAGPLGTVILFDPDVFDGRDLHGQRRSQLQQTAALGDVLYYQPGVKGEYGIALYVDEDVPPAFREAQHHHQSGMLLRVETGRLAVTGYEDLALPRGETFAARGFEPRQGEAVAVPAGLYEVEAWEQDPFALATRHEGPPAVDDIPAITRLVHARRRTHMLVGAAATACTAIYAGLFMRVNLLHSPWGILAAAFALYWLAATWAIPLVMPRWRDLNDRLEAWTTRALDKYPPVVVVMRRIEKAPDPMNRGIFGRGREG